MQFFFRTQSYIHLSFRRCWFRSVGALTREPWSFIVGFIDYDVYNTTRPYMTGVYRRVLCAFANGIHFVCFPADAVRSTSLSLLILFVLWPPLLHWKCPAQLHTVFGSHPTCDLWFAKNIPFCFTFLPALPTPSWGRRIAKMHFRRLTTWLTLAFTVVVLVYEYFARFYARRTEYCAYSKTECATRITLKRLCKAYGRLVDVVLTRS